MFRVREHVSDFFSPGVTANPGTLLRASRAESACLQQDTPSSGKRGSRHPFRCDVRGSGACSTKVEVKKQAEGKAGKNQDSRAVL